MAELQTATGKRKISEETRGLSSKRMAFNSIPVIDFKDAYNTSKIKRKSVAEQVREASVEVGFFYIKNHGISQVLVDRAFAASKQFFTLPLREKMELHVSKFEVHAGYIPIEGETLQDHAETRIADQKESLEVSVGQSVADPTIQHDDIFVCDTQWLKPYPKLHTTMQEYYREMWKLVRLLNRISALSLDLPENFFREMFLRPITNIRLLRYPPLTAGANMSDKLRGCGEHSDYLCYTLLAQDEVGGLEVLNSNGEWIQAPYIPGTFVVNTGDLISHWTNDLFASTIHRVTINQTERYRHAIAFFTGPDFNAKIECLPSCKNAEYPAKYPPTTTGDYLYQRLSSTVQYE